MARDDQAAICWAFETYYQPEEVLAAIRGRSWWQAVLSILHRAEEKTKIWYGGLTWKQKLTFWPATIYLIVVLFIVAIWLLRPAAIAALAMPSLTRSELPSWKLWVPPSTPP